MPGFEVIGRERPASIGTWLAVRDGAGNHRGALRLDPAVSADTEMLRGVIDRVAAVRDLALPGVLPIVDLVVDAGQVWLITETPAEPTLAGVAPNMLGDPVAVAVAVLRTLLALHAAGMAHGAVGPDTVVLAPGGAALIEAGLLIATKSAEAADLEQMPLDVRGWSDLVRGIADRSPGEVADRLRTAAATAELSGLAAAGDLLAGSTPSSVPVAGPAAGPVANEPTQLGVRDSRLAAEPAAPPAGSEQTQLGARRPVPTAAPTGELSFGPGVPGPGRAVTTPTPGWAPVGPAVRRPRRRLRPLGGLLTLLVVGAVLAYLFLYAGNPLQVTSATVAPAADPGAACDVTVDVVGTIHTNGKAGTISYQWVRNDGEVSAVLTEPVAEGTETAQVHLQWKFTGSGQYVAESTLHVLTPNPLQATGGFTYSCP